MLQETSAQNIGLKTWRESMEARKAQQREYLARVVPHGPYIGVNRMAEAAKIFNYCASSDSNPFGIVLAQRTMKDREDLDYNFFLALAYVYEAGRVAGIREERAKRKAKQAGSSTLEA